MIRIGALRYLNARPLTCGLAQDPVVDELRFEIPSLLADDLRARRIDLGLVPQVEACADPDYRIVPDYCIAAHGPVRSILLFLRREWHALRRIGVDISSRTSVELLRVLLGLDGVRNVDFVPLPPRLDALRRAADGVDAMLLIGDRALAEDRGEFERLDLGAAWHAATGLPFVFALWVGHDSIDARAVGAVRRAAERGLARRAELAREFSRECPDVADAARAEEYISRVIHYRLGSDELAALERFHELRGRFSPAPTGAWRPRFYDGPS